ncbi:hypothetical protein AS859_11290 [Aliarcobacter cryaerophilus]|jgi:hypothetical protein|uniref:Addiction module protein n=1 Tax=Aliarcobacter cryaerophilus TaxID=28198 RepID=A0A1V9V8T3_9BACT|nr:hypothetical protein AS859_11290 [Aliarcobacter cryaerophilus]
MYKGVTMTKVMNRVIDDIQELSQDEKNNLIKFLIASMDEKHDENSENEWLELSQKRYEEIQSGQVQTQSWNEIKQRVLS